MTKLTRRDARVIKFSKENPQFLAAKYDVSVRQVYNIKAGQSWSDITPRSQYITSWAQLTPKEVVAIRRSKASIQTLADKFERTPRQIRNILNNKSWRFILGTN